MSDTNNHTLSLCPLASGSKGNAYWIEDGETTILIDCGLSLRDLTRRVEMIERRLDEVDHIFITHEHRDHCRGLKLLLQHYCPTVWMTFGTMKGLPVNLQKDAPLRSLHDGVVEIGAMRVKAIPVQHDAGQPVVFRIDGMTGSVAVATDLGCWDENISAFMQGVDVMVCEANHDPAMLQNGPYPAYIKGRIASPLGHLNNTEGAQLAGTAVSGGATQVLLGHISENNNDPYLATDTFLEHFDQVGVQAEIAVAQQRDVTGWFEVGKIGTP